MANRLASEPSPYLRQHKDNPVQWWPWSQAAFDEAKRRDVPVFLSIGYATCHWCHVMAHESFEDPGVARLMNDAFVNIKVDREERPDVDEVYMAVCQMMTGAGGWPLNVLLTPDKKPFFAGTYFPKMSRHGRIGMLDLVPRISEAWQEKRTELVAQGDEMVKHLGATSHTHDGGLTPKSLDDAVAQFKARFDKEHGGFGSAPKFPSPSNLLFLLRMHHRTKDPATLQMVTTTLDKMADGGVRDHLGGGFHRYSTDREWTVPHFEKMLYDQALLSMCYVEAFQATGNPRHSFVARQTLDYVLRELQDPAGGFRSAEDADSEGVEGKFYVWTKKEIDLHGGPDAGLLIAVAGVTEEGNFLEEHSQRKTGANILRVVKAVRDVAQAKGIAEDDALHRIAEVRQRLFSVRAKRVRPLLDDKVLTDWNGLAIAAFATAGRALSEPKYVAAAQRCARFLLGTMFDGGRLRHRYHHGKKDAHGFLDDHAFLLWGLVELYEVDFNPEWLGVAGHLADELENRFAAPAGGFFTTAVDGEALPVRRRDAYDGALPSGNAVAAMSLLRLARITGETHFEDAANRTLETWGGEAAHHSLAFPMMLAAYDFARGPTREILIAGEGAEADSMSAAVATKFRPDTVLLRLRPGLARVAAWTSQHNLPPSAKAAAFVCTDHACQRPVTTAAELWNLLDG